MKTPYSFYMKMREKTCYVILKLLNHVKDINELRGQKVGKEDFWRVGVVSIL